jgi:hypothetical protein
MTGTYEIKQVTILNRESDELEQFEPKEKFSGALEDYRSQVLNSHYPEIKANFPDISKNDISIHLCHKKLA